jgi:hypothetical protein
MEASIATGIDYTPTPKLIVQQRQHSLSVGVCLVNR